MTDHDSTTPIDPLLAPPPIPETEESAMLELLAGADIKHVARKHNLPVSRLRFLRDSENFQELKERRTEDIKARTQALLATCSESAAMALNPQAFADDPKLALQFLKETGSLKQAQKELGQEVQDEDHTIKIELQNFGLTPTPPTIDVPSSRALDSPEEPTD